MHKKRITQKKAVLDYCSKKGSSYVTLKIIVETKV